MFHVAVQKADITQEVSGSCRISYGFDERGALKCVKELATLQACWIRLEQAQKNRVCTKQLSVQCHRDKL